MAHCPLRGPCGDEFSAGTAEGLARCSGAALSLSMCRHTASRRQSREGPEVTEDPAVRQYRYLLRTAPVDALEAAHREAIPLLTQSDQAALLATLRSSLLVGDHLTTGDHARLAHLVVVGERRVPGQVLKALPSVMLLDLAAKVLDSEASFGLLSGYAGWDGHDPAPTDDSAWADGGFAPKGSPQTPRVGPAAPAYARPGATVHEGLRR
jgi:hypothetical protein